MAGHQGDGSLRRLAACGALGRQFYAVVTAVANQVRQRVGDLLDHALVEFGRLSHRHQFDLLAQLGGQVAQHARETVEDHRHRDHADRHHRFLQVSGIALQVCQSRAELLVHRTFAAVLRQHGLGDHQFADQVDQLVDFFDRHAQRGRIQRRFGLGLWHGKPGWCLGRHQCSLGDRRTRGIVEESVACRLSRRGARRTFVEAVTRPERGQAQRLARHMEGEQVQQVAVAAGGGELEPSHAVGGAAGVQRFDLAEVGDPVEQLDQAVGQAVVDQLADGELEQPGRRGGRCRLVGGGRGLRRSAGAASTQRPNVAQQPAGLGRRLVAALMACQQRSQRIAGGQQQIDHLRPGGEFVAAQFVEQRLHLVRQLGHVGKSKSGRTTLDRMRAAEDRIERLVVSRLDVEREQHLLHRLQVLAGFLEENLEELTQVEIGGLRIAAGLGHGVLSPAGCSRGVRAGSGIGRRFSGSPCRSPRSAWRGQRV